MSALEMLFITSIVPGSTALRRRLSYSVVTEIGDKTMHKVSAELVGAEVSPEDDYAERYIVQMWNDGDEYALRSVPVAQWIRHPPTKREIAGSSPVGDCL